MPEPTSKIAAFIAELRHQVYGVVAVLALGLALAGCGEAPDDPALRLRVMTFNLKYASEQGEHRWSDRRTVLRNAILAEDPDLIGTQEGVYSQIKDMDADLPAYDWIGLGRGGGSREEFMTIFYKRERLEPMAYDHFWLSDTPQLIGSRTWGHDNRRMVTWVRFKDKATGVEFYHWNTHFDHRVQLAREKSADLLLSELRRIDPVLPVIVTGDFNASDTNVVHDKLLARTEGQLHLLDTWDRARERLGEQVGTFHGWEGSAVAHQRIDWILVTPDFRVGRAAVITYQEQGRYPSDHFPVLSEVELPPKD
ncbi:MAG: endonuclease/exonuclease/phosphatase family protein [Candidatus Marinimicrobia bacterium]|nr:endonuclease/exonuclease/phosphatase family protein [Candidatus Neomarinimicrobiota bacterium]